MREELAAFGRFLVAMGEAEQGSRRWQAIAMGYAASMPREPRNRHERRAQKARAR